MTSAKKKPPGRPFQPGQSGNPGGRPKEEPGLRELCRQHTQLAVKLLLVVISNARAPAAARVSAACAILDRGYGKPPQALELTGGEGEQLFPRDPKNELEVARRIYHVLQRPLREKPKPKPTAPTGRQHA
jgi:hypothetical protein